MELLVYALGISPALTTLVLYYAFLLLPYRTDMVYILVICLFYGIILYWGMHSLPYIYHEIKNKYVQHVDLSLSIKYFLGFLLIGSSFIYYTITMLQYPLVGHDILNYGIVGKLLYEAKSLEPIWIVDYAQNGFFNKIKNSPSFSLILVWENILSAFNCITSDNYFKSIGAYYCFLIIIVQYLWISKKNKSVALFGVIALLVAPAFFISLIFPHIDTFRIFLYILSFIFLGYSIQNKDMFSLFMFGISSGLCAFAHRIGLVLVVINCITLFVFYQNNKKYRKMLFVLIMIVAFGGSHYLFDLIWGRGAWIILQ